MGEAPENVTDLKGRVKEAAGDLTGEQNLKQEGKIDQLGEKLKGGVDRLTEKAQELLHHAKD